jgi:polyisoprenoid-binding protein YceI
MVAAMKSPPRSGIVKQAVNRPHDNTKEDTMSEQTATITTAAQAAPVRSGTWRVDPDHSRVGFVISHLGIDTIRGEFLEFEGKLEVGGDFADAQANGSVVAASVFTNQPRRDEHLRSPDFFDVAQYPELSFESSRIEPIDAGSFRITGELTMHGVSNELVLDAVVHGTDIDQFGNERVGLEVSGELSRGDYDLRFNIPVASGALLIAERVKLVLDISAIRQA